MKLDNITLIAVGSTRVSESVRALEYSMRNIQFPTVKIVTHEKPINLPSSINFESCQKLNSSKEYSHYIIYDLHKHIDTDHCLLVQWDGFILNPNKWEDEFLNWDYIGAPWPIRENAYIDPFNNHIRVGNGGFTLRSKKLLEIPQHVEIPFEVNKGTFYKHMNAGSYNEDGNICVHNRHLFEESGARFAPVDVAVRFSQELPVPESKDVTPFGFHRHVPESNKGRA